MLTRIYVSNYALIETQDLDLYPGFSVITGETGAGKSILLGALSLIRGERADVSSIRDKSKKCIVEGVFNIESYNLRSFFDEHELDFETDTIVRREINPDGKSRSFINDTPVTNSILKELCEFLIDIHSQHENLLLGKLNFRFDVLDSYAGILDQRENFQSKLRQLRKNENNLNKLLLQASASKKELDYIEFQIKEMEGFPIKEGEIQLIEGELDKLENAEEILSVLTNNLNFASEGDQNLIQGLSQFKNSLSSLKKYGIEFEKLHERMESFVIEFKDLVFELSNLKDTIEIDPVRLQSLNEHLDFYNRLLKKHGLKNEIDLVNFKDALQQKLDNIGNVDQQIEKLHKEIYSQSKEVKKISQELSAARKKAISSIEKELTEMLLALKLPGAIFKIQLEDDVDLNSFGSNKLSFLFSANKGSAPVELHKVASGGELSRLMLCLKYIMAKHAQLPTLIFDEIDTGVSGDVAHRIGAILNEMAEKLQVISITHSAQVAAEGTHHYLVFKEDLSDKTISKVKELNQKERINEIAKMISAGEPTKFSLQHAKELLKLK